MREQYRFEIVRDVADHGSELDGLRLLAEPFVLLSGSLQLREHAHQFLVVSVAVDVNQNAAEHIRSRGCDDVNGWNNRAVGHQDRHGHHPSAKECFPTCVSQKEGGEDGVEHQLHGQPKGHPALGEIRNAEAVQRVVDALGVTITQHHLHDQSKCKRATDGDGVGSLECGKPSVQVGVEQFAGSTVFTSFGEPY